MEILNLKPNHKAVSDYYEEIERLSRLGALDEGAVSPAFATLLKHCTRQLGWTLREQYEMNKNTIIVDGVFIDGSGIPRGYWEAKDTKDDLDKEIKKKLDKGYPKENILFQSPGRIVIWRNTPILDEDISQPDRLVNALKVFFDYQPPALIDWPQAVEEFKVRVPELATGLQNRIEQEYQGNKAFISAFDNFVVLCQETINPDIAIETVKKMLVQHLLTERIFASVFKYDVVQRNVIAQEVEKVIEALTSRSFSKHEFLKSLEHFYCALEQAASSIQDFSQKQDFVNTVYEKFFQAFSPKEADVYGIVYTPQSIVRFMVQSVEEILRKEFTRSLSDNNVHVIDPFVGTGSFVLSTMRKILPYKLPYKYASELHCNEIMLLPHYIASMNIEHDYCEITNSYEPFQGICLADTFQLLEPRVKQASFFIAKNTQRIQRQQASPIFVVISNPPYNAGQANENDRNQNRSYPTMDKLVADTYIKDSTATYLADLNDPYVKAFRWA